jgi:hypothetical protein
MIVYTISETTTILSTENIDNINIFCQYFVHPNEERQLEFKQCLKRNVENESITNIYLLNERMYTNEELGVASNKIIQVDIKNRLKFKDVFEYINSNNIQGYNVIINSDIFFDETIKNLFYTDIHLNKKMYALLRYDYDETKNPKAALFGNRGDSQDTWIIHSNFNIGKKECKAFNFEFGKPGCDNKMTYLMSILGFNILNDPEYIKTYHLHNTNIRNYTNADKIGPPYEILFPKNLFNNVQPYNQDDINSVYNLKYNHKNGNQKLFDYITKKVQNSQNFIIPRVAGIATQFAIYAALLSSPQEEETTQFISEFFKNNKDQMKNNAGIKLSSDESINKYSTMFLKSFSQCELYGAWAPFDSVYRAIRTAHEILDDTFKEKDTFYPEALDIFNYIYSTPWTFALKGKRVLIVSNFEESIKGKIHSRKEIYGIDLFPDCEIITIRPPQTQGSEQSDEFDVELSKFTDKLDNIKNDYDIALVSCGGYGNLVCSHIFNSGKSAIYVGGVLQMYWGILGNRWFNDRPDIIRLFLNKHWSRPKDTEKPSNHKNIEGSCYW